VRRLAALAGLVVVVTACGGSTGVQDAGKAPAIQGPEHIVRLWFIRPGGRVGVEGDLVPVTHRLRAFPGELARLTLRELERGTSYLSIQQAGYRSALGCCDLRVSEVNRRVTVAGLPAPWPSGATGGTGWMALAGAAQIQRTLAGLPGVRSVTVQGMTQKWVSSRLASGVDTEVLAGPKRRGSCASAKQSSSAIGVSVSRVSKTEVIAHVRASVAVSIELDLDTSNENGSSSDLVGATVAPCGVFDVTFSRGELGRDADPDSSYLVRVVSLAGPPQPGVTRRLGPLVAPVA
jgi:hypothetical protein